MTDEEMCRLIAGAPTKAESIRRLFAAGITKAAIARFMELRYQHVYNVLLRATASDQEGAAVITEPAFTPLKVDAKGKVQLPAAFLSANGLDGGGTLFCRGDPRGLALMSRESALEELREVARKRMPDHAAMLDALLEDVHGNCKIDSARDMP